MWTHRHAQPCLLRGKTQTVLVFLWHNFWMWDYGDTQLNHVKIHVVVGVAGVRTENEMWEMVLWFFASKMDGCLWALPVFPWAVMSQRADLGLLQPSHCCITQWSCVWREGMKQTWGTWEDRPGGKGSPLTRTGMGPAVGVHSQTKKNGLCFVLHLFSLHIIFNGYLMFVLCMP